MASIMNDILKLLIRSRELRCSLERIQSLSQRTLQCRVFQVKIPKPVPVDRLESMSKEDRDYANSIAAMVKSYIGERPIGERFSIGDLCLWAVSKNFKLKSSLVDFTETVTRELTVVEKDNNLGIIEDENRGLLYWRIE